MSEAKNTELEFELSNGTKVKMTLSFYRLYQLKSKNKAAYEKYNKIMTTGVKEELDNVTILHTAYLCANVENPDACMSELDFMQLLGDDRTIINSTLEELIKPKKK